MDFKEQLQFKKDFGMTINDAERILANKIKASDEVFALKLYLNGLDIVTGQKTNPTKEETKVIQERIDELYKT